MDYNKIDHSKDIEATQSNPNQNINLIQNHSTKQINKQDSSEHQRGYNELNSYAKNESHLLQHPRRPFSMPNKKQQNDANDLSSEYLEVPSCTSQPSENQDASFNKHSDEMQKEHSVLSAPKVFSGNILRTEFNMALTTDANTAEDLIQKKPVNDDDLCNIAITSTSEKSIKEHDVERINDNAMFQKSCQRNSYRNECTILDDNNAHKSIICSNQLVRADTPYIADGKEISESIAKGRHETNEKNNHMTKKQLQILMSRSCAEANTNSVLAHDHIHVKTRIHEGIINATYDDDNCSFNTTQEIEAKTTTDKVEVKTPDKIRFEEIENKLEEMFAGIEDEQLVHPTDSKNNSHTSSTKVENDFELDTMPTVINENSAINTNITREEVMIAKVCYESELPINSSHLTKAAKKSTDSYILESTGIESEKAKLTADNIDDHKFQRNMPPHRRLSVGIDTALLRISLESGTDINRNQKKHQNDKERTTNRNKMKKNSKNSCAENKRDVGYSKSLISNNKKKQFKSDAQCAATKQKQQTLKHRSIHANSLDNEDEPEERTQQTREFDNKIRSPFILVKHNGAITVVNAPTIDDFNEKNPKAKKTGTFVHERKNVRGCHSSTLSNRYDADTADSSWICVFCKQGPHKKGLGDLFGPYIVSIDCEEYQSAMDIYTDDSERFVKRRRIESSLVTEKIQARHVNETVIQTHILDTQNISNGNEETSFYKFSLGMTRISDIAFEIWFHEDCAIWAPNLFVIGSRLVGLEAAIWNSTRYKCVFCSKPGAILCCLQRDCKTTAHVPCARESNWLLDEITFWSYCKNHISKIFSTSSSN